MPTIDRIKLPSGNIYILADSDAQSKLENVYTKSETYTRAEVLAAIADAMKGGYVAVNTLPTASEETMGHIYLIPGQSGTGQNIKIEYVTIRSGSEGAYTYTWEELGTTELNLDNLTLEKGSGDNVLGEDTTFTASKPAVNITGGTSDTFVKSYPGAKSKLATTTVPNVTGNSEVTIPNVTGNDDVTIPNVTGNDEVSIPNVTRNNAKTLTFSMGTGAESTTLIIGGTGFASGSNTYQASEVTLGTELKASKVTLGSALSASKVTLGTELKASKVTLGTAKTVATGALTTSGSGADVMTGLGTAVTAEAVTGVGSASLAAAPEITVGTNDKVKVAKYDDLDLQKP